MQTQAGLPPKNLVALVEADPELQEAIKQDPAKGIEKAVNMANALNQPIYYNDKWIYRGVVIVLGLVVLIAAGGYIYLAIITSTGDPKIPEALVALGSGALGALAGLLAPSPRGNANSGE